MTLPVTGPISFGDVNVELGRAFGAPISLQETAVRNLAGIPSGPISMNDLRGKSAGITSVTASDVSGFGTGAAPSDVVVTTNSPNPVITGGTAPYNYLWQYVTGDTGVNVSVATIANPVWSAVVNNLETRSAIWRVRVTDVNGSQVFSNNITVQLSYLQNI